MAGKKRPLEEGGEGSDSGAPENPAGGARSDSGAPENPAGGARSDSGAPENPAGGARPRQRLAGRHTEQQALLRSESAAPSRPSSPGRPVPLASQLSHAAAISPAPQQRGRFLVYEGNPANVSQSSQEGQCQIQRTPVVWGSTSEKADVAAESKLLSAAKPPRPPRRRASTKPEQQGPMEMEFNLAATNYQQQQQQQEPLFEQQRQQQQVPLFEQSSQMLGHQFQQSAPPFLQLQQLLKQFVRQLSLDPAQRQQLQPSQRILVRKDGSPGGRHTKFEDLHPDSQTIMLQIQEQMNRYRFESERLDEHIQRFESAASRDNFELEAKTISQELQRIQIAIERETASIGPSLDVMRRMNRDVQTAANSLKMVNRSSINQPNVTATASVGPSTAATIAPGTTIRQITSSIPPQLGALPGFPNRPSPFMQHTVSRFCECLAECSRRIEELEKNLHRDTGEAFSSTGWSLESIPAIMSNIHDYLTYVASKVERCHQHMDSMKKVFLEDLRRQGISHDPFVEADRREAAGQADAGRRV